ncbi:hypothetical protein QWZ10_19125 [Paracoccus cavernae]|uniref:Uncharacterized protein n=1 Tax=Paracoccus cavernae TaxID=1571207 RepID=A0ABT8DDE4_9RHOB|nr:hypothetical protein [Paracoccus cavernae]
MASVVIPLPRRSVAIIDRTNVAGQPASKGAAMPIPSYSYPPRDEVPYLDWFGPHFQSVFVALNPFIKIHGGEPFRNSNWTPPEIVARAKRSGKECAVTWAEVATLCGFETIAVVNQALRLTGSKRIAPEYASVKSTELLLKHCREGHLYPPDEGRPSSPFECFFSDFATAAGQHTVLAGDGHPARREQLPIPNLADPEQINEFSEFAALDGSFYAAIYTDYHYWLVCQTAGSLSKARPEAFFEGFYANAATNDFWGIGNDKRGNDSFVRPAIRSSDSSRSRRAGHEVLPASPRWPFGPRRLIDVSSAASIASPSAKHDAGLGRAHATGDHHQILRNTRLSRAQKLRRVHGRSPHRHAAGQPPGCRARRCGHWLCQSSALRIYGLAASFDPVRGPLVTKAGRWPGAGGGAKSCPRWLRLYASTESSNLAMRALLQRCGAHEIGFSDDLNISGERETLFRLK